MATVGESSGSNVRNIDASGQLADIYANRDNLTDAQVRTLSELIPNVPEKMAQAGRLEGHTVTTGGSGKLDKETAILFLKTCQNENALVSHYLGLDTWSEQERAANPNNERITWVVEETIEAFMNDETTLNLSDRGISSVPDCVGKLVKLEILDISSNKITSLPDSIGDLKKLEVVNISQNPRLGLPSAVSNMRGVTSLYASGCGITRVPPDLVNNKEVRILDLSHNNLGEDNEPLPSFRGMTSLTRVDLSHNCIHENLAGKFPLRPGFRIDLRDQRPEIGGNKENVNDV